MRKALELLKTQTIGQLVEQFEMTETLNGEESFIVRGWIMDELERRDEVKFEAWVDSEEDSPRKYFV